MWGRAYAVAFLVVSVASAACGGSHVAEEVFDGGGDDSSTETSSTETSSTACAAGEHRCSGNVLEACKADRTGFDPVATCGAGLCDAATKTCRDACTSGESRCNGDVLETCNTGKTGFEPVKVCSVGLCDAAGKECDECVPSAADCVGSTPRACDSTGHWKSLSPCGGSTPICRMGVCGTGACSSGEYRCAGDVLEQCNSTYTGFDPVKTCGAGLCDAAGKECDECKPLDKGCSGSVPRLCDSTGHWKDLTACSGTTPYCSGGTCAGASTTTTVTFPSTTSTLHPTAESPMPLGAGGGGVCYRAGSYVQQTFPRSDAVGKLDVSFKMSDQTGGPVCTPGTLYWSVKINGIEVGTYSWTGGGGDKTIVKSYSFAPISPATGGTFTLRYEATSTVCGGGGSWNWYAGGTATLGP